MGKTRGAYNAEYPVGTIVKIVDRRALEEFMRNWKLHDKLRPEQLEFASKTGKVKSCGSYHSGDELYQIEGIPGIWHEQCPEVPAQNELVEMNPRGPRELLDEFVIPLAVKGSFDCVSA